MKYALFEHKQSNMGLVNIGDFVQSCAAEQFLPNVDFFVERDALNKPYEKCKIIMNGWFTDSPHNWPPNENLEPLFISFHLQPSAAKIILSKPENVSYLKKYQPIGCRDYKTVEILREKGIESYFSFCLTTTLDIDYKVEQRNEEILFVDPLYSFDVGLLKKMNVAKAISQINIKKINKLKDYFFSKKSNLEDFVPKDIIERGINIDHYVDSNQTTNALYTQTKDLLARYSRAKLVVTSRIHCALPCLALETPVLFLLDGLKDEKLHMSRFRGILDHINVLTNEPKTKLDQLFGHDMNVFHPNDINWENPPENPASFKNLSDELKTKCRNFVNC